MYCFTILQARKFNTKARVCLYFYCIKQGIFLLQNHQNIRHSKQFRKLRMLSEVAIKYLGFAFDKLNSNPSSSDTLGKLLALLKQKILCLAYTTERFYAKISSQVMMIVYKNNLFTDNLKTHLRLSLLCIRYLNGNLVCICIPVWEL